MVKGSYAALCYRGTDSNQGPQFESHDSDVLYFLQSLQAGAEIVLHVILTLRLLMSYIYIYIYIWSTYLFLMFLDHTQRRSTVGRTPLDE